MSMLKSNFEFRNRCRRVKPKQSPPVEAARSRKQPMRIAACQMNSRQDKTAHLAVALDLLDQAAKAGADLAVLPEYFDYLSSDEGALAVAEPIPGPLSEAMAARTRALGLRVLAGSMHARHAADGRRTDASLLFDRAGTCG
jgi:predicted amidohydrolase